MAERIGYVHDREHRVEQLYRGLMRRWDRSLLRFLFLIDVLCLGQTCRASKQRRAL